MELRLLQADMNLIRARLKEAEALAKGVGL